MKMHDISSLIMIKKLCDENLFTSTIKCNKIIAMLLTMILLYSYNVWNKLEIIKKYDLQGSMLQYVFKYLSNKTLEINFM